jgi:hypothetical protein
VGITSDTDLTLTADNIKVSEDATYHIIWLGSGELTWYNKNGSNISSYAVPYGGTVEFPVTITLKFLILDFSTGNPIERARVYISDYSFFGCTDANGEITLDVLYTADIAFNVKVRKGSGANVYKPTKYQAMLRSTPLTQEHVIQMLPDGTNPGAPDDTGECPGD